MPYDTKEKQDEWRKNNKEKINATARKTYLKHREKRIAKAQEYQKKNRLRVNELERERYKKRGGRHKSAGEAQASPQDEVVPPVDGSAVKVPIPVV